MDTRHILVTGGNGRLGKALGGRGCIALGRDEMDVTDPVSVAAALVTHAPKLVINAAAYTAVDKAETEPEAARALNAYGAGTLARCCAEAGIPLIQISTDCVFGDGDTARPVIEDDAPSPLSVYGQTKLEGEQEVLASGAKVCVARVAWLFDAGADTFIGKMLAAAKGRDTMRVVSEMSGRPTPVGDLADTLVKLAALIERDADVPPVLHLGPPSPVSRFEWAQAIFAASAKAGGPAPDVAPCPAADFPEPARRPHNLILDVSRADALLGQMPDWTARSREAVEKLLGA